MTSLWRRDVTLLWRHDTGASHQRRQRTPIVDVSACVTATDDDSQSATRDPLAVLLLRAAGSTTPTWSQSYGEDENVLLPAKDRLFAIQRRRGLWSSCWAAAKCCCCCLSDQNYTDYISVRVASTRPATALTMTSLVTWFHDVIRGDGRRAVFRRSYGLH